MASNIRNLYTPSASSNVTINNFDDLTNDGGDGRHDQIDLTAIFDALGGKYSDGSNDLQDRENALQISSGDFNGDGKLDFRIGISGLPNFQMTLLEPVSTSMAALGVGAGSGNADDIAVMSGASTLSAAPTASETAQTSANGATTGMGGSPLYDSKLNAYSINADHQVVIDGIADPNTGNVTGLLIDNGSLYQTAPDPATGGMTAGWWEYTPGAGWHNWTQVGEDPRLADASSAASTGATGGTVVSIAAPTPSPSVDGTTTGLNGAALYDSKSNSYSINADHQVVIDGSADPYTANVTGLLMDHGSIYQTAPNPATGGATAGWWEYTPGAGWHNWTQVSEDPRLTDAASTSAVGSSTPTPAPAPVAATGNGYMGFPADFARLSDGVNVERDQFNGISDTDLQYLKSMGVENIRIFLSPNEWAPSSGAMNPETNSDIQYAKAFMDRVVKAGMAVVVTPFAADNPAFLSNPNDQGSINQYVSWMKEFATFINNHYSSNDVFIETKNEPVLQTSAGTSRMPRAGGIFKAS